MAGVGEGGVGEVVEVRGDYLDDLNDKKEEFWRGCRSIGAMIGPR